VVRARRAFAVAVAAAGAVALACDPAAAATCARTPYAYAGVSGTSVASGVAATVSSLSAPRVRDGHVAAFVGLGGPGLGPSGSNEWIQIGLSGFAGGSSSIYYEIALPGRAPVYEELLASVGPGETHRIAVLELRGRTSWWRVWLDGRPATQPIQLPASHGRWQPMAAAESWAPGAGTCNGYAFRFDRVSLVRSPGGAWERLGDHYAFSDAGYRLVRRSSSAFVAVNAPGAQPRRELVSVGRR
jgi:hypothetical protein